MGLEKHVMTYNHHYSIIQNSFTALKIPCTLSIYSWLSPPSSLEITDILPYPYLCLFYNLAVSIFPKNHPRISNISYRVILFFLHLWLCHHFSFWFSISCSLVFFIELANGLFILLIFLLFMIINFEIEFFLSF